MYWMQWLLLLEKGTALCLCLKFFDNGSNQSINYVPPHAPSFQSILIAIVLYKTVCGSGFGPREKNTREGFSFSFERNLSNEF